MITVLMATHDGAGTLPEVLNAYCKLDPPDGGWRVVIVDNGSADDTKEIIASFQSRLALTYVFEPTLGKNVALNAGLLSVTGDLVAMTDDDALPNPDWLVQMRLAADSQPSYSIFGGAIVPNWEVPPEAWILKWQCPTLAITDPGWEEGPIPAPQVYGPNMAVRMETIKAGYRFDTSLGSVGSRYRMGDETDFLQRLAAAGFKAWHCKRAVVAHMIRKEQMNQEWVLRRAIPSGRADFRREFRDAPHSPAMLLGIPRYMIRDILTQASRFVRARLTKDADTVFTERWRLNYLIGRAMEGRVSHKT
jgi:glycosyltransferase involved in cell wall biosynthesis